MSRSTIITSAATRTRLVSRPSVDRLLATAARVRNEDLLATSEDLKTLNEELQAAVEELTTTIDELQAKSVELHALSTSLEEQHRSGQAEQHRLGAILATMGTAVLVLDAQGTVVLTNAAYERLIGGTLDFVPENEQERSDDQASVEEQHANALRELLEAMPSIVDVENGPDPSVVAPIPRTGN